MAGNPNPASQQYFTNQSIAPLQTATSAATQNVDVAALAPAPVDPSTKIPRNMALINAINAMHFPDDMPKYRFGMVVCQYSRERLTTLGNLSPIAHYQLPLPEGLKDFNQVDYEQTPLGAFVGTAAENGGAQYIKSKWDAAGNSLTGAAVDMAGDAIQGAKDALTGNSPALNGAIGSAALSQSGALGGAASAFLGISPNQFLTILLKGPTYQQHQFAWKLAPNSFEEAETLRKMIKELNNHKSPGLTAGNALFTFPMIFQLYFSPNAKWLYKFKPAVLEAISVDYAPNGGIPSFLRSGSSGDDNPPESIVLQLQFLQLEFELANNYNDSTDPINFGG